MFDFNKKVNLITGHYGSGKTNLAVNLALLLQSRGKKVVVVDLDIVNPYFRTSDFAELFAEKGIDLISPLYANSNLDLPALSGAVEGVLRRGDCDHILLDVGGDDAGAIALGRYSQLIEKAGYDLFYVLNQYRYLTATPEDSLDILRDIEAVSRLRVTKLINCSNLGAITTAADIAASIPFAERAAEIAELPLWATAAEESLIPELQVSNLLPVSIYVKPFTT